MKIIQILRKRNERFFSIETVFDRILGGWQHDAAPQRIYLPAFGISLRNLFAVFNLYKKNRTAIFHVTGDAHYAVVALPRNRVVLTIHDCVFLRQHSGLKRWVLKLILLDIPVRYVKHITTISEKSKAEIVAYSNCNPKKITVIPNPVSPAVNYRTKIFNEIQPQLLFIGLTPNKNLERVCKAIQQVNCQLQIIGRLSDTQLMLLKECGIRYKAVYGLSDEEMAAEYVQADIVLFPSLYEGFGLPIIEGFKAGRVVVTSNLSPMKDIAKHAACLVDPLDSNAIREGILKVIKDASFRAQLINEGLNIAKSYQPEAIAELYYNYYRSINDGLAAK
jgi:glycosyltransferase involved in cell wall biosynthesis